MRLAPIYADQTNSSEGKQRHREPAHFFEERRFLKFPIGIRVSRVARWLVCLLSLAGLVRDNFNFLSPI